MNRTMVLALAILLLAPCASAEGCDVSSCGLDVLEGLLNAGYDEKNEAQYESSGLLDTAEGTSVSIAAQTRCFAAQSVYKVMGLLDWLVELLFGGSDEYAPDTENEEIATSAAVSENIASTSFVSVFILASAFAAIAAIGAKLCLVPLRCKNSSNDQTLENPARRKIFELIKSRPGVRVTEIANEAGVGWGAALYHISVLEKKGYITSNAKSRRHSLFENNGKYTREERMAATILRVGKSKMVMDYIKSNPGSSTGDISSALGISGSITSWYTKNLCEYGLVRKARNGKSMTHFAVENSAAGGASVH